MHFSNMWLPPKETKKMFSPEQEKILKEKYGVWATVHTIASCVIAFMPFIVFMLLVPESAFNPTTSTGNTLGAVGGILGLIGSAVIGIGFVNLFMLLVKQYLGHLVTAIALIGGFLIDLLASYFFTFVR